MIQVQTESREVESDKTIEICTNQIPKANVDMLGEKTLNG